MASQLESILTGTDKVVLPYNELLTEEEKQSIHQNSNIVRYNKRDVIFLQNTRTSHIMFLKSGLVKIYKESRMGKIFILKIDTPGSFLGLMSVFGSEIHQYSGASVDLAEVYYIDINTFRNVIMQNGKYALKLIQKISNDGLFIFDRLISQSQKQLPGRIADVILYFSEIIYKSDKFTFPLTRRELAELAGTTKESLIRTLTEFKNDKIIDMDGSKVEIRSMKIVKTLSELG
jgi:CRP/FNR family transcriptional regulator, polysaccharide utilization system transcription regulator